MQFLICRSLPGVFPESFFGQDAAFGIPFQASIVYIIEFFRKIARVRRFSRWKNDEKKWKYVHFFDFLFRLCIFIFFLIRFRKYDAWRRDLFKIADFRIPFFLVESVLFFLFRRSRWIKCTNTVFKERNARKKKKTETKKESFRGRNLVNFWILNIIFCRKFMKSDATAKRKRLKWESL